MLISEEYRRQNRLLHEDKTKTFGVAGKAYVGLIKDIHLMYGCNSILDYGCGKGGMKEYLPNHDVRLYDPAIPEFSAFPDNADLVTCLDVMEHIEPEHLEDVLDHIRSVTGKVCLMSISLRKAVKTLPDGRNAHLIVETPEWWLRHLIDRFSLESFNRSKSSMVVVLK